MRSPHRHRHTLRIICALLVAGATLLPTDARASEGVACLWVSALGATAS